MTIPQTTRTRVRARLSALEYLIAASSKLAQADAVLKRAVSVHGMPVRLDGLALEAVQQHVRLAQQGIAFLRRSRNPVPPTPFGPLSPQVISGGHVLFATENHHE